MSTLREVVAAAHGVAAVISALAWLVIAVIMARLLPEIRQLSRRVDEFSIDGPLSTTFRIKTTRAARHLQDAVATKLGKSPPITSTRRWLGNLARPDVLRQVNGARVLWIDDRPENNRYEMLALQELGVSIETSGDTEEGLGKLRTDTYDLIITDMGRPSSPRAGYDLLAAVRQSQPSLPVIIYSGSDKPQHKREASERGANGATADPRELLRLVVTALSA